ncbi:DUF3054 domain-containing protein [Microbacterium sp. LMC-P-041]|uniref:DUF3054 domain-containing protein n=1 Tax=Microbacterium sp. LMC-P-041 TaxID=3040293 RepID=UPI002553F19D|nr:DUF3054 domain-containing protein [Microbacterium sp. LMC-P-041]
MRFVPAFIVDAVLVLVFAVIGRASHGEDPGGFLLTAWPFIVALLLGHVVAALLPARPRRPWSLAWGAVVWLVTVVGGLLLRVVAGDTAQIAFIIVTTLVLGVFLVGWRAVAALLRRRAGRASDVGAARGRPEEREDDDIPVDRDAPADAAASDRAQEEPSPEADPESGPHAR